MLLSAKRIFERHLRAVIEECEGRAGESELEDLERSTLRLAKA